MPAPTVYLDTSVINFLFATDRPDLQAATLDFFKHLGQPPRYHLLISAFVVEELAQTADAHHRARLLQAIRDYPIELAPTTNNPAIYELADSYLQSGALPAKKMFDALHVAYCVVERINYLASWNYKHLANVNRERRLTVINLQAGFLHPLRITTPLDLIDYDA